MTTYLLTIIIPTYNRADHLSRLLKTLSIELNGLEKKVKIIIGDNASTDYTPSVTNLFLGTYPTVKIIRHAVNLGAEENFCKCIDVVDTSFFWIIGDDDLPKKNVISQVIKLLESQNPDLLYMKSEPLPYISGSKDGVPIKNIKATELTSYSFSREVNVWLTFISAMIVNLDRLRKLKPNVNIRQHIGTSLVQLSWVLPLLMVGDKFYIVFEKCILATSGNSGEYRLLTVFGKNFPMILDQECGPHSLQNSSIMKSLAWESLPRFIWMGRFKYSDYYMNEDFLGALNSFKGTFPYALIFWPLIRFPKPLAYAIWFLYRLIMKIERIIIKKDKY
jgi:glycosyltransferase involved in cell wall biosynthesis